MCLGDHQLLFAMGLCGGVQCGYIWGSELTWESIELTDFESSS